MKKNTKIGIVVLMLVAMLAVTGVILNQPAYAFKMDVNPSIEIKANRLERVVEIIPLNEDARNLLKDFKLTDKSLEKTIEDLADLMVLKGYISGGKDNLVMITVNDENTNQKVVEGLNKAIKAYLENKQIEATIVNQAISENNNNNQNKSGKEIIANRIKYIDDDDKKIVNLNKENVNANKDHENKKSSGKIISREEAKNIALGLVNGTIVEFELDEDDGRQEYEIEIIANGIEYEIEIDASTGKVLEFESDDYDDDDRDDD